MFSWTSARFFSRPAPETNFLPDIWLQIYRYLSPLQLGQLAFLSSGHYRMTQQSDHYNSVVWGQKLRQYYLGEVLDDEFNLEYLSPENAKALNITQNLRERFGELTQENFAEFEDDYLRHLFICIDMEDQQRLTTALASSNFTPDILLTKTRQETSLLELLFKKKNAALTDLVFQTIKNWFFWKKNRKTDNKGNSFPHWIAAFDRVEFCRGFATKALSEPNFNGQAPLDFAAFFGSKKVAKWLLARGCNWDYDFQDFSPAGHAAYKGHFNLIKFFFVERYQEVLADLDDDDGPTSAFALAAEAGHTDIVLLYLYTLKNKLEEYLIEAAYLGATRNGKLDVLQCLFAHVPLNDINKLVVKNQSLLDVAAKNGHSAIIAYLLDCGAKAGFNALYLAAKYGHAPTVAFLLQKGIRDHQHPEGDNSAFQTACSRGESKVVRVFLAQGANPNRLNDAKLSPLHLAAGAGDLDTIKILVEYGAMIDFATPNGDIAWQIASDAQHTEAADYLLTLTLQNGIKLNELKRKRESDDQLADDEPPHKRSRFRIG